MQTAFVGSALKPNWLHSALLVATAICAYLAVPLMAGGRLLVPSFPTVALIPFLYLAVRRNVTTTDFSFLLQVSLVLLLSIALSPGYMYIEQKMFALIQCAMAITVAVLLVRLMQQLPHKSLERALLVLWCIIMIGAVLEVLEVIRGASDAFRAWAYSGTYTLYEADMRDYDLVGWSRPKLFSSEPSHVTKFFIAAINAWLLVRVTWGKAAVVACATVLMLVIMGSPMLLVSAAMTLAILVWNQRAKLGARVATVTIVMLLGALVGAYFAEETFSKVAARVAKVDPSSTSVEGAPSSEERRMLIPYLTLADTLLRWPLFGAGIGGKEVVVQHNRLPVSNPKEALGNNAFADIGIYLGIVGGAWFIFLLLMQARRSGVRRLWLLVALVVLFSQLVGGFDSFRYWGFIALFWGALTVADVVADPGSRAAFGKT